MDFKKAIQKVMLFFICSSSLCGVSTRFEIKDNDGIGKKNKKIDFRKVLTAFYIEDEKVNQQIKCFLDRYSDQFTPFVKLLLDEGASVETIYTDLIARRLSFDDFFTIFLNTIDNKINEVKEDYVLISLISMRQDFVKLRDEFNVVVELSLKELMRHI